MLKRLVIPAVAAVVMLGQTPAVSAQSNVEVNAGIQFDFLSPGARSLGLAGAFTAMADDATAAYTNPAGLRELSRKEVSFEGRVRAFSTPFTLRGHAFGDPSGIGTDVVTGLVDGTSKETIGTPSFFSFVYPTSKWAVAGYRHELAHFKSSITTEGAYVGTGASATRLLPAQGSLDLKVVDYGVSASYNISDKAAVGAGVVIFDFSSNSLTSRFSVPGATGFSAPSYSASDLANTQAQTGSDHGIGFNVGVTAKPSPKVQLAAVFRRGAAFDLRVTNTTASGSTLVDQPGKFHVPDVFSAGLVVHASPQLRVAVDYSRVQYSQLTGDFVDLFALSGSNPRDYRINDGNELHLGAEYLVPGTSVPVALRGGVWYDPAHSLVYTGSLQPLQALFRDREDSQLHYAFGAGFGVRRFELNAGVDLSKPVKTVSVSTVIRF
jgi:long-chain fatty acid transport protein